MKKFKTVLENNDGPFELIEKDSHYSLESYLERNKDKIPFWNIVPTTVEEKSIFINTATLISDTGNIEISIKEDDKNLLVSMVFKELSLSSELKGHFNALMQLADTVYIASKGKNIILTFIY